MDRQGLADVIRRAQLMEPAALEALVDAYSGRVFGFVYRMIGSRDDAEDLVQEVFLRVTRMISQYQDDGRFESWLFRIAANLVRDRGRRFSRQPGRVDVYASDEASSNGGMGMDGFAGNGEAPGGRMELGEDVTGLTAALGQIPAAEREVIMMRHYSDMSFKEIAEAMGTPLGTALARAHRGLQHLRELMGGSVGAPAKERGEART
jgi:RNA polymerase sigma-70 factor (ECF subfamily)